MLGDEDVCFVHISHQYVFGMECVKASAEVSACIQEILPRDGREVVLAIYRPVEKVDWLCFDLRHYKAHWLPVLKKDGLRPSRDFSQLRTGKLCQASEFINSLSRGLLMVYLGNEIGKAIYFVNSTLTAPVADLRS